MTKIITTLILAIALTGGVIATPANAGCWDKTATFGKAIPKSAVAPVKDAVSHYGEQDAVSTTTGVVFAGILTPFAVVGTGALTVGAAAVETAFSPFCLIAKAARR